MIYILRQSDVTFSYYILKILSISDQRICQEIFINGNELSYQYGNKY